MSSPDIRHRTGYLFTAVVVGHIILISAQVNTRGGVPVLEAVVFGTFAEVQRIGSALVGGGGRLISDYAVLRGAREENEKLRQRIVEMELLLQQQRAAAEESGRLRALLEMKDSVEVRTTAARVIGGSARPDLRTLTIDKGTGDGIVPDMAVLAPAGVVGRVALGTSRSSKVQLLIDRSAAAAALVSRSRAEGIVVGTGEAELRLEYLSSAADVLPGDRIVTSGMDGIYPKGFVIGNVTRIVRSPSGFASVFVRPEVDFGTIEEVLVVLSPLPRRPEGETTQ